MRSNKLLAVLGGLILGTFVAALSAPEASAQPLLSEGDRGEAVTSWQENVNDWLQVNRPEAGVLAVDGIFGPKTEAATIQFQRAQDIRVDGIVGPQTRAAMGDAVT